MSERAKDGIASQGSVEQGQLMQELRKSLNLFQEEFGSQVQLALQALKQDIEYGRQKQQALEQELSEWLAINLAVLSPGRQTQSEKMNQSVVSLKPTRVKFFTRVDQMES